MEEKMCQSCGMPLKSNEDFGTEQNGQKSADYCRYCYENGKFTAEGLTLDEAIEGNIQFCIEGGVSKTPEEARAMLKEYMPTLKRWASVK